ncbi:hypothetical protein ACFSTC_56730 [Nonomuraea ferruginea]
MRSEEDLIRTLHTAAGHAEPEPTLAASVAARRRSRRREGWARTALAAAAVVLVAGGTTVVLSDGGGRARPAAEVTRGVEQAAEVWPEAMFTVPGTAVDGREYQPMAAISPAEVLVSAVAPGVKPDRLEVFDTGIRQFRTVTSMPKPNVPGYRFRDVKARDNHIVWWGETPHAGEGAWADFWYVPRAAWRVRARRQADRRAGPGGRRRHHRRPHRVLRRAGRRLPAPADRWQAGEDQGHRRPPSQVMAAGRSATPRASRTSGTRTARSTWKPAGRPTSRCRAEPAV